MIIEPTQTTEISSALIDLIMTNRPENITNKDVFANSIADHDMITCLQKINNIRYIPNTNYYRDELISDIAKID